MKTEQEWKRRLCAALPRFTMVFCVLQPLLDVLGFWQNKAGLGNGGTLTIRVLLLICTLLAGFLLSGRKWIYYTAAGVFALYLTGHVLCCVHDGYLNPIEDLTEQVRIFLMPATVICFITFMRKNEKVFPALQKGLALNAGLILLVELLSLITGTDPHTYSNKGIGVLGWFLWANSQSAILSILCPLTIVWAIGRYRGKILPVALISFVSFGMLFCAATRLAYAALLASGLCLAFLLLLCGKEYRRSFAVVLLLTACFAALLPLSPMMRNLRAVEENAVKKQELVDRTAARYGVQPGSSSTDDPEALKAAYSFMLQGLVDRFGLERVAKEYDNSLDVSRIWDRRRMLLTGCHLLMEESSPSAKVFGLELCRMRQTTVLYDFDTDSFAEGVQPFDPENDFLGVFYLCGGVGLALILFTIGLTGFRALFALIRRPKQVLTPEFAAFAIALCVALVYAYATVSVLRRNNASIYLALVLAGLWIRSDHKKTNADQEVAV